MEMKGLQLNYPILPGIPFPRHSLPALQFGFREKSSVINFQEMYSL